MLLHPTTINLLKSHAKLAAPNEAAGLIDGVGKIFHLTNKSESPHNSFVVDRAEIAAMVSKGNFVYSDEVTLWHTHPSGLIGPSKIDMQQKTPFKRHLVVTLLGDEIKLTWY